MDVVKEDPRDRVRFKQMIHCSDLLMEQVLEEEVKEEVEQKAEEVEVVELEDEVEEEEEGVVEEEYTLIEAQLIKQKPHIIFEDRSISVKRDGIGSNMDDLLVYT